MARKERTRGERSHQLRRQTLGQQSKLSSCKQSAQFCGCYAAYRGIAGTLYAEIVRDNDTAGLYNAQHLSSCFQPAFVVKNAAKHRSLNDHIKEITGER